MCWVVCSQEGETKCRNKIPEYLLYRFSSCCCAKHVLVGSLHKQELVQSGAVCSFPWPCSGVLCVTPAEGRTPAAVTRAVSGWNTWGGIAGEEKAVLGVQLYLSVCATESEGWSTAAREPDGMCWGQPVESFLLPLRSPTQNRSLTHPNVLFAVCVPKAKQVLKQGESGPKYQLRASCSSPFLSKIPDRFPRCGFFLIGIKISWEQSSAPDIGKNRALQYFLRRRRPVLMAK